MITDDFPDTDYIGIAHENPQTRYVTIDGSIYVEDVICDVEIDVEEYDKEPFSWGQSRGKDFEFSCKIITATVGDLTLNRSDAVKLFGEDAIVRAENELAQ